ncbi:MAG: hypothetical protein U0929_09755 [Planctomycetaceae bacterium]
MFLAAQFTDDQVAVIGCAIVFAGCLIMMLVSQKIGDSVRGRGRHTNRTSVAFPATRQTSTEQRKAA